MRSVCACVCSRIESKRFSLNRFVSFRFTYKCMCQKWQNEIIFLSFFLSFISIYFWGAIKLLHNLKTLSIADMGVIPYELLVPLGQLRALNLSGNHLVNVSMQILHPVDSLEVSWIIGNKMPFIIFISVNIFFWYQFFFPKFPFV